MTNAGDMFAVVSTAATVDPEVVELAASAEARRRIGARSVIDSIAAVGEIRSDLSMDEAADVLSMLNSPATFNHLVRQRGWTPDRYRRWLATAMVRELLAR